MEHQQRPGALESTLAFNNVAVSLKPGNVGRERFIAKFRSYIYTELLALKLIFAPTCRVHGTPYASGEHVCGLKLADNF